MDFLVNHVESLIFCSSEPISGDDIKKCLDEMFEAEISDDDIHACIKQLIQKYDSDVYSFCISELGGGYQFLTKPAYQASISILVKQKSKKRLSTSALETLAILAYKQPVTKGELEVIRGVSCDYSIQKLLDKGIIEIKGKADTIGKPMLYGTNKKFMEYFGINSLDELPELKDFQPMPSNEIGEESIDTLDSDSSKKEIS